jgi:hypothetical protein
MLLFKMPELSPSLRATAMRLKKCELQAWDGELSLNVGEGERHCISLSLLASDFSFDLFTVIVHFTTT